MKLEEEPSLIPHGNTRPHHLNTTSHRPVLLCRQWAWPHLVVHLPRVVCEIASLSPPSAYLKGMERHELCLCQSSRCSWIIIGGVRYAAEY